MRNTTFTPNLPVTDGDTTQYLSAIENQIPCDAIVDYQVDRHQVGAYLLRLGSETSENFRLVFGFKTPGFHSSLKDREVQQIFNNLVNTLKQLPMGEQLTIRFSSHSEDGDRQAYLSDLLGLATHPLIALMLIGQKKRVQQLAAAGKRKPKSLKIYVTFTAQIQGNKQYDITQIALAALQEKFQKVWQKFAGTDGIVNKEKMDELLRRGYDQGFTRWQQMLSLSLGLQIVPMTAQELYTEMWSTFNKDKCPVLPQRLVFDGEQATEQVDSEVHFISHLFKNQSVIPVPDREWIFIKDQYVAPLIFWDKPGGFEDERHELRYIWEAFIRDAVTDTDCIVQFCRANNEQTKKEMVAIMKHARSDRSGDGDEVVTTEREEEAIEAQQSLYRGEVPIHTAVVFLVRRDNLRDLETDCNYLRQCFPMPADVQRERTSSYQTFFDTLPTSWGPLLTYRSSLGILDLRLSYKTDEAPGFSCLVNPQLFDNQGLEFITVEGRVPVYLDLFSPGQHKNIGFFGTTRSGKSVLVTGIFTIAQAQNIPTIIVDAPPSDAASTFRDYVQQLGGEYFDIRKHSSNLLEQPDLSAFMGDSEEEREELRVRTLEFKSFIQNSVMILVLGDSSESSDPEMLKFINDVEALLLPTLDNFFIEPSIVTRYDRAYTAGFGSLAWQEMPTLPDYIEFFGKTWQEGMSQVELDDVSNERAAAYILKRLRTVMKSSLGAAIGRPSTIRNDANLLVYALTGLENSAKDIQILSLAAQAAIIRRTLKSKVSIAFFDEVSVQLRYPAIGRMIATFCANGAKAGVRVLMAMQDPNTLVDSKFSEQILQNLQVVMIGRIVERAIDSFKEVFKLEEEVIAVNASSTFLPDPADLSSTWLVSYKGVRTYLKYYPSIPELAVVANNPAETEARKAWMQAYAGDVIEGFIKFAEVYSKSIQSGSGSIPLPVMEKVNLSLPPAIDRDSLDPLDSILSADPQLLSR